MTRTAREREAVKNNARKRRTAISPRFREMCRERVLEMPYRASKVSFFRLINIHFGGGREQFSAYRTVPHGWMGRPDAAVVPPFKLTVCARFFSHPINRKSRNSRPPIVAAPFAVPSSCQPRTRNGSCRFPSANQLPALSARLELQIL